MRLALSEALKGAFSSTAGPTKNDTARLPGLPSANLDHVGAWELDLEIQALLHDGLELSTTFFSGGPPLFGSGIVPDVKSLPPQNVARQKSNLHVVVAEIAQKYEMEQMGAPGQTGCSEYQGVNRVQALQQALTG